MNSYATHQQRPLTPPNDRNKDQLGQHVDVQNKGDMPNFQRHGEETSLSDLSYLSKQKASANAAMPPVSTAPSAPSAPSATATRANPFAAHQDHPTASILSDIPTQSTKRAQKLDDPFNDVRYHQDYPKDSTLSDIPTQSTERAQKLDDVRYHQDYPKDSTLSDIPTQSTERAQKLDDVRYYQDYPKDSTLSDIPKSTQRAQRSDAPFNDVRSYVPSTTSSASSTKYGIGRNDTTHRIESEVLNILNWKNPVRSGSIFALVVGSIIMTRWYSLLQIGSSLLTLAIGVNLIYVNFILQGQKLVSSNHNASHPYNNVIHNNTHTMLDKQSVRHYSTVLTEVSETMIRALTRIVFIENTATSIKWMSIFFIIWKVSAHVSTMDIVLAVVISAFIFPRIYISNREVVNAQLQKGQTLIQTGIEKAQNAATTAAQDTYTKSRAAFAKAGTTGTDAKNTLSRESVTVKQD